jgi:hypothetical protein
MPPCIIAMLRQHGHPPVAWPCEGVLGMAIGSVAAERIMPHMPPDAGALAVEPGVGAAPHIWALAGAAHARARAAAVKARELRMACSSEEANDSAPVRSVASQGRAPLHALAA